MYMKLILLICVICLIHHQGATARSTSKGISCTNAGDCAADECCISKTRPRGRRRRQLTLPVWGTCSHLGQTNENCFMTPRTDSNGAYYVSCPCQSSFSCIADGGYDHPLGPIGTCQS